MFDLFYKIPTTLLIFFAQTTEETKNDPNSIIPLSIYITAAGVFVALITAIIASYINYTNTKKTLLENKRAEKRKLKEKALNEFYGPLLSYLNSVEALFNVFRANKPKDFRTLTHLLNPSQTYLINGQSVQISLSKSDKTILNEVIEIEKKIEELVLTKAGLVDDEELMFVYVPNPKVTDVDLKEDKLSLLAVAITHFRILRLAYEGKLDDNIERYKKFVYPRELDIKIRNKIKSLQNELKNL